MEERNSRRILQGTVSSNKMTGSATVLVTDKTAHPLYGKVVTRTKKYLIDDPKNECSIGDKVEIMECRPISKNKYFRLVRIVEKVK